MTKIFRISTLLLLILPIMAAAQSSDNLMRSNGRIYVVIAVILTIFAGLILYLVRLDKKVSKLKNKDNK